VYGLLKNSSTHDDQRWKDNIKTREKVEGTRPKCKIPYARIWEVRASSTV